jgi:alpha-ribazole phosphatase/probable phosphoglycerate mutase
MQQTVVDFLRHGEVKGAACFRGITDDPLSELGWQQMMQQCQGGQWQVIVSSPLRRCLDFASHLALTTHVELVTEMGWVEMNFGDWEGLTAAQIGQQDPDALHRFYSDPVSFTPPRAESYPRFINRIETAWEQLIEMYSGKNLLVVTHAGVIRTIYTQLLHLSARHSFQIEVPHACLTRFSCFDDANGRFVQLNFHKPL